MNYFGLLADVRYAYLITRA